MKPIIVLIMRNRIGVKIKMDKIVEILKEKHGKELSFKNGEVYYLFFKDGLFSVYLDEDTNTVKIDVEFLPEDNTFIYSSDEYIEPLI